MPEDRDAEPGAGRARAEEDVPDGVGAIGPRVDLRGDLRPGGTLSTGKNTFIPRHRANLSNVSGSVRSSANRRETAGDSVPEDGPVLTTAIHETLSIKWERLSSSDCATYQLFRAQKSGNHQL